MYEHCGGMIENSIKNRVIHEKEEENKERNQVKMEGRLGKTIIQGSDHISRSDGYVDDSPDLDRIVTEMTSYK